MYVLVIGQKNVLDHFNDSMLPTKTSTLIKELKNVRIWHISGPAIFFQIFEIKEVKQDPFS